MKFLKSLTVVLVSLLIGGVGVYFGVRSYPQFFGLSKSSSQIQSDVDDLTAEVGKLITLPTDERPTIATITDIEKLKDQAFFKSAKNGDRVLIYTNAKKAILYRPSEKIIVEVGAVNINQASPAPSGSPEASPQAAQ